MAWRIEDSVIRGEIDNRQRNRVTGRIWISGRVQPLELDLIGNAWRDLAGRKLTFVNPHPQPSQLDHWVTCQTGAIGDCTASRKVKVPDIPLHQIADYHAAGKKWSWHWANCLYLEWFSTANGRVVIESAAYELTIAPDITWDMTADEEAHQHQGNDQALARFTEQLTGAAEPEKSADEFADDDSADTSEPWDDEAPLSEKAADRLQEESDQLVDRIMARMESDGADADYEKILEEELEKRRRERGEESAPHDGEKERTESIEEMNRASEDALEDPELRAAARRKHPLAERAFALSIDLLKDPELHGGMNPDATDEHPVMAMISSISIAGAKLAGALNGCDWPPAREECGLRISGLKRARRHLHQAILAADDSRLKKLADLSWLDGVHRETSALIDETDALITELRGRLERGFD